MGCSASVGAFIDRAMAPITLEEEERMKHDYGEMAKCLLLSQGQLLALYQKVMGAFFGNASETLQPFVIICSSSVTQIQQQDTCSKKQ